MQDPINWRPYGGQAGDLLAVLVTLPLEEQAIASIRGAEAVMQVETGSISKSAGSQACDEGAAMSTYVPAVLSLHLPGHQQVASPD